MTRVSATFRTQHGFMIGLSVLHRFSPSQFDSTEHTLIDLTIIMNYLILSSQSSQTKVFLTIYLHYTLVSSQTFVEVTFRLF